MDDNVSDSGGSVASEAGSGSPLSDLTFKLDDIANIISCLYTLSVTIRQPAHQDRLRGYAEIDLSHYESFDNQHVREKFPNAKPFLIKRLVNANTQRRQYFHRAAEIANRFKHVEPAISVDKPTLPALDNMAVSVSVSKSTHTHPIHRDAQPAIESESDGDETATSFGTMMETGGAKLLKVPDPPDADRAFAGDAFQCPYCYSLIIVKNSRAWQYVSISLCVCRIGTNYFLRQHVFRDLRPYVCTFDSCTKLNRLFETLHDWYDHEVRQHRREWYCAECAVAFPISSSFARHLEETHSAEKQDVLALVGTCERAMSTPQQCPLCTVQSEHTAHQLRSHLGLHMQQLALFTLPGLGVDGGGRRSVRGGLGLGVVGSGVGVSGLGFYSNPSEGRLGEDEGGLGGGGGGAEESHGAGEVSGGYE